MNLRVKIFADGADLAGIVALRENPLIRGYTTNPTLMRKAGIAAYETFARQVLEAVPDRPISFEVFSDDFAEMERQATKITAWGDNVYVKIPVTNTRKETSGPLVRRLVDRGIKLNVTAILTLDQVRDVATQLAGGPSAYVSLFAGRIADTGRDPVPDVRAALEVLRPHPNLELIWASPREILNVVQASDVGCHIITVTHDLLQKLPGLGRDLDAVSLDTVRMFHGDAKASGFVL
jgi:transaldolase